jgi:hypothetical protein
MAVKEEGKRIKQLIADLFSKDEKKVLKTISIFEAEGTHEVLQPLCECYIDYTSSGSSQKVAEKIEGFLNNLADSTAAPALIELIRNEDFAEMRKLLLAACWQSKLDMTLYLADFVAIATEGTFLEVFECATIIDNLEGPFDESQLLESQLYLKEYLEKEKGENDQIDELVSDIAVHIKDFDRAIQ